MAAVVAVPVVKEGSSSLMTEEGGFGQQQQEQLCAQSMRHLVISYPHGSCRICCGS